MLPCLKFDTQIVIRIKHLHSKSEGFGNICISNILTWFAKVGTFDGTNDVCISVDKLHKLFQHPQTTFAGTNQTSDQIISTCLFQFWLDIGYNGPNKLKITIIISAYKFQCFDRFSSSVLAIHISKKYLDYCDNEGAKCNCSKMVNSSVENRATYCSDRNFRLVFRPIPFCKNACQNDFPIRSNKIHCPIKPKQIKPLHPIP